MANNLRETFTVLGSGCGSVGRAVASNSRGPLFVSSHRQKYILNINCQLYWKDENKEKEAGNGPFKKNCIRNISGRGSYLGILIIVILWSIVPKVNN